MAKRKREKAIATLKHDEASRKNIPTAEFRSVMDRSEQSPVRVAYERRNRDLDPQLVWRGKDEQDWSDLVVQAPPLYIQEKVHPKVLIDDLRRRTEDRRRDPGDLNRKVRVAGPFTVESLSPHRVVAVDENEELLDRVAERKADCGPQVDFAGMILDQLASAGVQQAHKEDRIAFAAVTPWPGSYICGEGRYVERGGAAGPEKRAGIFVGPEFGTVARPDLVAAAQEAGDAGFDVLIACAFNYEAHASEFDRLGRIPVLKARMNADLHMADELKNTGKGNLFVIFGESDIDILPAAGGGAEDGQLQVKISGVDVFHPNTGEVRSDGADGIACWFIDTDYNKESFFSSPRLLPRRQRPLQGPPDHPEGRDRPRRLGLAPQRRLASVRPPRVGPHRRQGHQPPRRRGDEGVSGVIRACRRRRVLMASGEQLKALLKSHVDGDDDRFFSVAMQVAAHEARRGHGRLADELRALI